VNGLQVETKKRRVMKIEKAIGPKYCHSASTAPNPNYHIAGAVVRHLVNLSSFSSRRRMSANTQALHRQEDELSKPSNI